MRRSMPDMEHVLDDPVDIVIRQAQVQEDGTSNL